MLSILEYGNAVGNVKYFREAVADINNRDFLFSFRSSANSAPTSLS